MKIFTADEAKARVADFNAEREHISQKRAEEFAEKAFDEIRDKSANGGRYITLSICDIDIRNRVVEILKSAGYTVQEAFSRVCVDWGE